MDSGIEREAPSHAETEGRYADSRGVSRRDRRRARALTRWYGKYWIAYVKDDTGRLRSWAYGDSRKEAREGLILDGLVEHSEVKGQTEVMYELVVQPPRRPVMQ